MEDFANDTDLRGNVPGNQGNNPRVCQGKIGRQKLKGAVWYHLEILKVHGKCPSIDTPYMGNTQRKNTEINYSL